MSRYDQLAFASRPTLYLAAPTTTDQSATSAYTFSSNTLVAAGQPIIKGHPSSFRINDTDNAVLDGNPVFRSGVTTEFVLFAAMPEQEIAVVLADNGNGVFLNPSSIILRVAYVLNESTQTLAVEIPWTDWHAKLHCIVTIGSNQLSLTVNGTSKIIALDGSLDENITETELGAGLSTGYSFLIDGFGVYSRKLMDKSDAINDDSRGHNIYAAAIYHGVSTDFSSYNSGGVTEVTSADLSYIPTFQQNGYFYQFRVPATDAATTYISVETNDDTLAIEWALNNGDSSSFTREVVIPIDLPNSTLTFLLTREPQDNFKMRIEVINSADILSRTPALLTTTGQPVFPADIDDSIVNCPQGVNLTNASWHGVWLTSDSEEGQNPPKTIELIFKPEEDGIIFTSADGEVSLAVQAGYDMYLNGQPVVDMTGVLLNQWNHLVLTVDTPLGTDFDLNADQAAIHYLLLTAYPQVLDAAAVADMYKVAIGADDITVTEIPLDIAEGVFDTGQPFQVFSNNWSIVGSGGN